jgi:HSP20 family protein
MSNIMRWDPFRQLEDIQAQLNRALGEPRARGRSEDFLLADWAPAVDVQETDGAYTVKADLPDVKKEDVAVEVHEGTLTIRGERKQEKEEKGKKFHRIERAYGQFVRSFSMPGEIDAAKVQAQFKDGVLTVTLPKTPAATPKKIAVNIG